MNPKNQTKTLQELIISVDFPEEQYLKIEHPKKQIVLHHSAGWDNARGMFDWWKSNTEKVATCVGIQDDGTIYRAFDSKYYAWHVNVASKHNHLPPQFEKYKAGAHTLSIERQSIGIEICNWGNLQLIGGKFHAYASKAVTGVGKDIVIPESKVVEYTSKFRGSQYYEKYTDEEIESVRKLLAAWCAYYKIPKTFNEDMFDISENALKGTPGIWAHVSYRTDKFDVHPQPELIQMLRSL